MGYKSFEIFVDNPTASYQSGAEVTGKVVLVLDKPKKVRGLLIKFDGFAKVSWPEYDNNSSAEEEYFSNKYFLFGNENSEKEIPTGKTVYPFTTILPTGLPTSFEGGHGHIRYTITAILDRPWKKDEETKMFITVNSPVDLNLLSQVKEPVIRESSISFCCFCCTSRPMTLACFIPYSGCVPGQSVVAHIEVDNASSVHISSVKCRLRKELKWIVKMPKQFEKINKFDLLEFNLEGVPPKSSKSWIQHFEIPQMPIINLDACTIIKVNFYLEIEAEPAGGHTGLMMKFPITLGTVPLYQQRGSIMPLSIESETKY